MSEPICTSEHWRVIQTRHSLHAIELEPPWGHEDGARLVHVQAFEQSVACVWIVPKEGSESR